MPLFAATDLTCLRGERLVFQGLSFAVEAGGALVLLGPNGSGKSSLLRLMAGLLQPFSGGMSWDGEPVSSDPDLHRSRVHYVGHLDAVKPVLSARENLAFWASMGGAADPMESATAALERLGVPHIADVPGRYLSAGQKRRLNLARILAAPAPLWLLDEPSVALDRAGIGQLEEAIAEHRRGEASSWSRPMPRLRFRGRTRCIWTTSPLIPCCTTMTSTMARNPSHEPLPPAGFPRPAAGAAAGVGRYRRGDVLRAVRRAVPVRRRS